jgi:hypothetical protein
MNKTGAQKCGSRVPDADCSGCDKRHAFVRPVTRGITGPKVGSCLQRTRFLLRHAVRQPPSLTAFNNNHAWCLRFSNATVLSISFPPPPKPWSSHPSPRLLQTTASATRCVHRSRFLLRQAVWTITLVHTAFLFCMFEVHPPPEPGVPLMWARAIAARMGVTRSSACPA